MRSNKKDKKKKGGKAAKFMLLHVIGVFVTAGVALISVSDKLMHRFFRENEEEETADEKEE